MTHTMTAVALLAFAAVTAGSSNEQLDDAIRRVTDANEERVVRLTYLGDAGGALSSVAPTVTGWRLKGPWVLTSLYALERDPAAVLCRLPSGDTVAATVVGRDHNRRLALLRLEGSGEQPPRLRGRAATVGETAIALGRAFDSPDPSVNVGVVSAVRRLGGRAIQTDAAVSPVNYGGPLLGLDGRLLGILTPLAPPGQSGVSLYDSGVGFAVPAVQIDPRLDQLAGGQDIRPGWLGAGFAKDDPLQAPAVVQSIRSDGPAAQAGLIAGDTITGMDDIATNTLWSFRNALRAADAGQRLSLTVERDQMPTRSVEVVLGERPADDAVEPKTELLEMSLPDPS